MKLSKLKNHSSQTPKVISSRFRFFHRGQKIDESIAEYITVLRRLADDCEFGDRLEKMLQDHFACQRRILQKNDDVTFGKVFHAAIVYETAPKVRKTRGRLLPLYKMTAHTKHVPKNKPKKNATQSQTSGKSTLVIVFL